jgi:WD40 repeat protein
MMRYWWAVLVVFSQAALHPAASDELQPLAIPVAITTNDSLDIGVSFSPDGRLIARHPNVIVTSASAQIDLWDSTTGASIHAAENITQFQWVGDEAHFFALRDDPNTSGDVQGLIYDPYQQREVMSMEGMLALSDQRPSWLIMYHNGRTWLRHASRLAQPIKISDTIVSAKVSTTGRYVAVFDPRLKIYSLETMTLIGEIDRPLEYYDVFFNADDSALIVRLPSSTYQLYSLADSVDHTQIRLEAAAQGCASASTVEWFTTGSRVLFSSGVIWDYVEDTTTEITGEAFLSPDNRWIATLNSGRLTLHDADTLNIAQTWDTTAASLSWSPDSRWIVTYGYEGYAHLYNIASMMYVQELPHYHHFAACGLYLFPPQWNPNSRQLATYVFSQPLVWRVGDRGKVSLPPTMSQGLTYYEDASFSSPTRLLENGTLITIRAAGPAIWYQFETDDGRIGWIDHTTAFERVPLLPANTIWIWNLP